MPHPRSASDARADGTRRDPRVREPIKFVLAGPVGAGKTTAIRAITDREPVSTERWLTDDVARGKSATTVALDFTSAELEDGTPLLVFGMPGQERFAFMRPILLDGAYGAVLLLDGSDPEVSARCRHWLDAIRTIDAGLPIAIGITRTDLAPGFNLAGIRHHLARLGVVLPVFIFDARDRSQVLRLVRALLTTQAGR